MGQNPQLALCSTPAQLPQGLNACCPLCLGHSGSRATSLPSPRAHCSLLTFTPQTLANTAPLPAHCPRASCRLSPNCCPCAAWGRSQRRDSTAWRCQDSFPRPRVSVHGEAPATNMAQEASSQVPTWESSLQEGLSVTLPLK